MFKKIKENKRKETYKRGGGPGGGSGRERERIRPQTPTTDRK